MVTFITFSNSQSKYCQQSKLSSIITLKERNTFFKIVAIKPTFRDRFFLIKNYHPHLRIFCDYSSFHIFKLIFFLIKRYCFPFGRPEGALKQTLSLLERVLMKDIVTPVSPEEVKVVIRKCLENAALVNYTRISQVAKVEGK